MNTARINSYLKSALIFNVFNTTWICDDFRSTIILREIVKSVSINRNILNNVYSYINATIKLLFERYIVTSVQS